MPNRLTHGPRPAEESRTTSERRTGQSRAGWPVIALELQRAVGNRAAASLLHAARTTGSIQRTEESADLLTKLAVPQIRPGPAVDVQKALIKKLDVDHAAQFAGGLLNLGGILIDEMPTTNAELIDQAELVSLPAGGGFISAGGLSKGAEIKALGFDRLLIENTLQTMIDSKEIEYLRLAGLPNDEWKILIEVHYFRARDMSATGFHKDTRGETLFVNLNYAMDKQVIGPEYVVNPPPSPTHDEQLAESLPEAFRQDLAVTRARLGTPTEFGTGLVDPHGYVAFVDEAIHHATPHHWQRAVTAGDLTRYLEAKHPAAFKEASTAYPTYAKRPWKHYLSWFSSYVEPTIISAADSTKWLRRMEILAVDADENRQLTRTDLKAAMTGAEFDDLLEVVGGAENASRTRGGAAGFQAAQITGSEPHPIRPPGRPPLKRQLSDPAFRKRLPPAPAADEKRAFFRTWVRVIKKAKADDLRRRLEGPTTL